jgi:hypothetical protein
MFGAGLLQDCVELGNHRDMDMAQKSEDMFASQAAIYAKLVLEADDISVGQIQKICSTAIAAQILLGNLKTNFRRISVTLRYIIYGNYEDFVVSCIVGERSINRV